MCERACRYKSISGLLEIKQILSGTCSYNTTCI